MKLDDEHRYLRLPGGLWDKSKDVFEELSTKDASFVRFLFKQGIPKPRPHHRQKEDKEG